MIHQMTGSQIMTPKYCKVGIKIITNTIFPNNSIMLEIRGVSLLPIPWSEYRTFNKIPRIA